MVHEYVKYAQAHNCYAFELGNGAVRVGSPANIKLSDGSLVDFTAIDDVMTFSELRAILGY